MESTYPASSRWRSAWITTSEVACRTSSEAATCSRPARRPLERSDRAAADRTIRASQALRFRRSRGGRRSTSSHESCSTSAARSGSCSRLRAKRRTQSAWTRSSSGSIADSRSDMASAGNARARWIGCQNPGKFSRRLFESPRGAPGAALSGVLSSSCARPQGLNQRRVGGHARGFRTATPARRYFDASASSIMARPMPSPIKKYVSALLFQ